MFFAKFGDLAKPHSSCSYFASAKNLTIFGFVAIVYILNDRSALSPNNQILCKFTLIQFFKNLLPSNIRTSSKFLMFSLFL